MLRNRIIHQNELVYIGPAFESGQTYSTPITTNLDKVQSISYDFGYARSENKVLAKSRPIDRPITSSPLVNVQMDYLMSSFHNEHHLGMSVTSQGSHSKYSLISGFADETNRSNDKRNLYLATTREGTDLIGGATGDISGVLCFHDCQLTSYSASFSLGDVPKASASFEGINASYFASGEDLDVEVLDRKTNNQADTINVDLPMTSLVSSTDIFIPGDINIDFYNSDGSSLVGTGFEPVTNEKVQNFSLNFGINRAPITLSNYKITYDKLLTTPVVGGASLSFIDHGSQSGNLADLIDANKEYKIITRILKQGTEKMVITLNSVTVDKVSYSHSVGGQKTADLSVSFSIDPFDKNQSVNFSGAYY